MRKIVICHTREVYDYDERRQFKGYLENLVWETYCALNFDGSACITLPNCYPCEYPCN